MKFSYVLRTALVLAAVVLILSAAAPAQDCAKQTDQELALSVMAKMRPKYGTQMNHINVRSKGGVVTVEGWASTKGIRGDIEKLVKKVKCVKKVDNKLTIGVGGGCPPGSKPCGTICIPEDEICNIGNISGEMQSP